MGSSQSSHANANPSKDVVGGSKVGGRKIIQQTIEEISEAPLKISRAVDLVEEEPADVEETDDSSSDSDSDDEEEDDEEYDEFFAERLQILEDARKLRNLADAFLHPEKPVEVDPAACGRNYFSRPSAPEQESKEEADERAQVLADAAALKKLAVDYAHPEMPVVTSDSTAYGRNFFSRPSAPEQETAEEAEERAQVLADARALKKAAFDFLHPEVGVKTTDPTAFGRNYFSRPSAPEQESFEEAEERAQVLADARALKKFAVDYAHPELPVVNTDATAFGRNYFSRPSAPEQESFEEAEERAQILAEAASLKKLAMDYAHPELPVVTTDSTAFGRNYFSRPSAPEQESFEEAEERAQILAEVAALKKLAVDYAHPELPVVTTDSTAFGRNYFSRPSAPEQESFEEAEERAQILAEAAALKKLAMDYAHPELPVVTSDPTACGRNYFSRPSAPQQESFEEAEERAQILAEVAALKKLAVDYAHPELPVVTTDPTAFGRNYFSRPSAPEQEIQKEAAGYEQIELEEEVLEPVRDNNKSSAADKNRKLVAEQGSDEGSMERSPSSVMLFGLENQAF